MSLEAIDHVDLVVSSLERSVPFYEALLRPLGYIDSGEIVGERGERVVYLNRHDSDGSIGLRERQSTGGPETGDRYALGLHHLALSALSRKVVDQIAEVAADLGAMIESGRGSTTTRRATMRSSSTTRTRSSWSSCTDRRRATWSSASRPWKTG
jgi:catechol 2,3-dioxygenase-like lactoylglutathione lyase family enzyme